MFADKKQHDNRMRKFRNRKIIMLQLWLGFHLQWLTKSKHSCQNVERRTGETQHWTKSGKFARKQRATLLHWIVPGKRGELTCVMAAMYTAIPEEDSQSSTAEILSLRYLTLPEEETGFTSEVHSLYVTIGIVCGNGLTYPSMPKR